MPFDCSAAHLALALRRSVHLLDRNRDELPQWSVECGREFRLRNHFAIDLAAACISAAHGSDNVVGDSTRLNSNLDVGECWIDATATTSRYSATIVTVQKPSNGTADVVRLRRVPYTKTKVANMCFHIPLQPRRSNPIRINPTPAKNSANLRC